MASLISLLFSHSPLLSPYLFPSLRYDWHQTGSQVVISIYAKCIVPEETHIEANPTNVSCSEIDAALKL